MKRILFFIASAFLLLSAAGCINDPVGPDVPKEPETRTYSFKVSLPFDGEAGTRSLINVSTAEPLYSLAMYAFADGVLKEGPMILSDLGGVMDHDFEWNMPGLDGKTVTFYALGNYDGNFALPTVTKDVTTMSEMQSLTYEIDKDTFKGFSSKGILAASTFTIENFDNSKEIDFNLKRLFAKYEVKINIGDARKENNDPVSLVGAKCNKNLRPFHPEGSRATSISDMIELDKFTPADSITVKGGNYAVIYIPENLQGTVDPSIRQEWYKIAEAIDTTLLTRLDFRSALYDEGIFTDGHWTTYHIYPGMTMKNSDGKQEDFNVTRNVHKKLNLTLENDEKPTIAIKFNTSGTVIIPSNSEVIIDVGVKSDDPSITIANILPAISSVDGYSTRYDDLLGLSKVGGLSNTPITIDGVEYQYSAKVKVKDHGSPIGTAMNLAVVAATAPNITAYDSVPAIVLDPDITWEGENRWYMPGTSSSDYMEIKSRKSYFVVPSTFSDMEACFVSPVTARSVQQQGKTLKYKTGAGYVPCTLDFESEPSTGKYFIKFKARYSDIDTYYHGASGQKYVCRGEGLKVLVRKPDLDGNMVYLDLNDALVHLDLAVVSRLVYQPSHRGNSVNGWEDDYCIVPCLYHDKFTDGTQWLVGETSLSAVDGDTEFIVPVGAYINQTRFTELGGGMIYLTETPGVNWMTSAQCPYYSYFLSNVHTSGGQMLESGVHFPSLTYQCYFGDDDCPGDPDEIRDTQWYEDLDSICDDPLRGLWRGNLFYKFAYRIYDKINNVQVADGGYFDFNNGGHYLRIYDYAENIHDILEDAE